MKAKGWSSPATSSIVLKLLENRLDWRRARVADVGAGRGAFSKLLATHLSDVHGLDPVQRVFPCDLIPESFEVDQLECAATRADGRLPFEEASFDAVVSIEVIEHVEDQFAFLRELVRITRPGGTIVVTTPNTLNMVSRLRSFACGFPQLFDPLPFDAHDPRCCGGHIHPISPYFLAYGALRAGMEAPRLSSDRRKASAVALAPLCLPALWIGSAWMRLRLGRKRPALLEENRDLLRQLTSRELLLGRSAILCARRPLTAGQGC